MRLIRIVMRQSRFCLLAILCSSLVACSAAPEDEQLATSVGDARARSSARDWRAQPCLAGLALDENGYHARTSPIETLLPSESEEETVLEKSIRALWSWELLPSNISSVTILEGLAADTSDFAIFNPEGQRLEAKVGAEWATMVQCSSFGHAQTIDGEGYTIEDKTEDPCNPMAVVTPKGFGWCTQLANEFSNKYSGTGIGLRGSMKWFATYLQYTTFQIPEGFFNASVTFTRYPPGMTITAKTYGDCRLAKKNQTALLQSDPIVQFIKKVLDVAREVCK